MIEKKLFGRMPSGEEVYSYELKTDAGSSVKLINLGATIVSINVPDANGVMADVVCGYDSVEGYLNNGGYQGAIIGRYGNRIENSSFVLGGKEYSLYNNEGKNHLHGGKEGFDRKLWDAKYWEIGDKMYLQFSYTSLDGEEGYPGKLSVKILYSFDNSNTFSIDYKATTDKKTVLNLTNHAYFNLGGYNSGNILKHSLWIDSDSISEINENLIPTGKSINVENTPFDFRKEKLIGKEIDANDYILKIGQGYDHNFILNTDSKEIKHLATLKDTISGRIMKMYTNQPCVQIYTANCINEDDSEFKGGVKQRKRCAVCLETQHAPNSPNISAFPSTELNPGELYDYTTVYKFEN